MKVRLSPRFWPRLAFSLAIVGIATGAVTLYAHLSVDPLADAPAYYLAATRLNAGQPLYPAGADPNVAEFYRYPPLLAVALRPVVAVLPFETFRLAWEAMVLGSFGLLLARLGLTRRTAIAVAILGMPVAFGLSVAQAHAPLTLLLAIGSPLSIALAANLKLFPMLVAVYWLGRRDWRSLTRFAGWLAALGVLQLVLEPRGSIDFLRGLGLDQVGEVRNLSPYELSPVLWAVLLVATVIATYRLASTRWGWASAVALSTLAPPRLLGYMLMGLLAALGGPKAPSRAPESELLEPQVDEVGHEDVEGGAPAIGVRAPVVGGLAEER